MIAVRNARAGRVPRAASQPPSAPSTKHPRPARVVLAPIPAVWNWPLVVMRWMYRGYAAANGSDMAAAVAFNTLIALVPMLLLGVAISGLFLKNDQVMDQARLAIDRLVPGETTDEAFTAAFTARQNSGWIGVFSFIGLAWVGTGFVSCLARSMNKIYGVRNSGYINEKQRGFTVLMLFSLLFIVSAVGSILPTFFVNQNLPEVFDRWLLASGRYQLIGYGIGFVTANLLFLTLYRIVPNAGQRLMDVWPGTLSSAVLFLAVTQAIPLYIRFTGGGNRFGQIFGFVSLLVFSLLILAHIILFGAYINACYQRRRRLRRRQRLEQAGLPIEPGDPLDDLAW